MKKYRSIIIFLLIVIFNSIKANNLDSLSSVISNATNDTLKVNIYFNYIDNNVIDKSEKEIIFEKLNKIADNLFLEYKKDTTNSNNLKFIWGIYFSISDYYYSQDYNKALKILNKEVEFLKFLNKKDRLAKTYNKIANLYKFISEYERALEYYQKSLDLYKLIGDKVGEAYSHIGIANVFINWKKYKEGIKHYNICFKICENEKDTLGLASASTGIGNIYFQLKNNSQALRYHKLAYFYYSGINDKEGIALSLLNLGDVYTSTKENEKALKVYNEALEIALKIDVKIRVALIYGLIAEVYYNLQNYNVAIQNFNLSLPIAKETNYKKVIVSDYKGLAFSYKSVGEKDKAFEYLNNYYLLKDSIFNEEKHKQLSEVETKYETVQKEKIIKQQKFKLEKDRILNEKRTYQRNFVLLILLLVFVVMVFIIRSYRSKRRANILLAEQKQQISNKNEELNQQNEEIKFQRDEIEKQKDIVEEINHEVSQSIDYATRLQKAVLPEVEILKKYLSEHFVLFKPKDRVSGDFYWWAHVEGYTVITAADCTGHGVPGAFMSMLGASFLKEIVQKEYVTHTGVILRKLRKEIIKSLKQKGKSGEQKDGMDMAIISINHETNTVQFSGANNPIYLIRNSELGILNEDNKAIKLYYNSELNIQKSKLLYEIKPDKMPIAIYDKMDNFSTHEIKLDKGDQIYMFSDGFADQFGGKKGKKFKYKPFKNLLLENAHKPMEDQKNILLNAFEKWKGIEEQVDDVLVIGLRI